MLCSPLWSGTALLELELEVNSTGDHRVVGGRLLLCFKISYFWLRKDG